MGVVRIKGSTGVLANVNVSGELEVSVENWPVTQDVDLVAGAKVIITDGTQNIDIETWNASKGSRYALNVSAVPFLWHAADALNHRGISETDDGEIAAGQKPQMVICIMYVKSGAVWVPMTQP